MKICFPARKKGGKDYISVDDIMTQVQGEPHGGWLAGSNLLWHGGLHISTVTAPDSVLTAETVDTAVPLQFMAGGEVVAWRLNRDYLKSQYNGQTLQYSSTFVLVKSVCQPDPKERKTWLEFYSLYMGLAPLSEYPETECRRVTDKGDGIRKRQYSGAEKDGQKAPAPGGGSLRKGTRVAIMKQMTFVLDGKTHPFGLAKVLNDKGELTGQPFWVSVSPEFMKQEAALYAHLPAWMQQAVKQGASGAVVKPAGKLEVAAGDAVGFLAKDIDPVGMGKVESSHFAHIEVLSHDAQMPAFLDNPGSITGGRQYIRIPSGKSLYQKTGSGDAGTFRAMSCVIVKDSGKILPADKCNPQKDAQGKTWYEISPGNWMRDSDVDVLHQYDLRELGFTALEEAPTADMSKSLREGWMKSAFNWLSEQVNRDRGIRQQQVSDYYKKAVSSIDTDGDGELSAEELFYAVHHPEMEIRNIAARMVVKHDSEWFGDSSHHKWEVYFQNFDSLRMKYAKQWRDDVEWMSQVEGFKEGKPVWHMHPVVFLDALSDESNSVVKCSFCSKGIDVTPELLIHCYGINAEKAALYSPLLTNGFAKYGINNCLRISHFLGQVGVETQMLTKLKEGFYYTDGDRLWRIYYTQLNLGLTKRFPSYTEVQRKQYTKDHLVRNEDELAKTLFPSEYAGMDYRGRGLIHLTHEETYRKYKEYSGNDVISNPKLLEQDPALAVDSACWFWSKFAGINGLADSDNLNMLTYKVNTARLDMIKRGEIKKLAFEYIKKNNKGCNK